MKKNNAQISMGIDRASHAAQIAMATNAWQSYEALHADIFAQNGLKKIVLLDEKGTVVARNSSASELVNNALHTNASTLRHEDFLIIQEMITDIRRRKLNGIADLKDAGLSFQASITDQVIGTESASEMGDADQEMNPNGSDSDELEYSEVYAPLPITHKGAVIPWRQQGFSYKTSASLKESIRKVAERLEETLFNGNPSIKVSFGGEMQTIYGYTTHPDRATGEISDWSLVENNDSIVDEVIAQIGTMFSEQGGVEMDSVCMYFPKNFKSAMDRDYSTLKGDLTVAERIKRIPEIKDVKFGEMLNDSEVVFVELTERTIQLGEASDIISVPHIKTNAMASQQFTTYAAMVPIIKTDSNGNTGILHATVAE